MKHFISLKLILLSSIILIAVAISPLALAHPDSNCQNQLLRYGSTGDCVRLAQVKLAAAGFMEPRLSTGNFLHITNAAVRSYQTQKNLEVDGIIGPITWASLDGTSPTPRSQPTTAPLSINFSKADNQLRVYQNGQIIMQLEGRSGGNHFDEKRGYVRPYPSTNGNFAVQSKYEMLISRSYSDAKMPYSLCYNGSECIHYSSDFASSGYTGSSHGCINVRDYEQMKRLYAMAPTGTQVVIH